MSEYTLQIPDDLFTTVQQLAAQQRVSVNQLLISVITAYLSPATEIYSDEDIAQWIQDDQLSAEQRQHVLQKVGVSFD